MGRTSSTSTFHHEIYIFIHIYTPSNISLRIAQRIEVCSKVEATDLFDLFANIACLPFWVLHGASLFSRSKALCEVAITTPHCWDPDNLAPVSVPKYLKALLARGHGCLTERWNVLITHLRQRLEAKNVPWRASFHLESKTLIRKNVAQHKHRSIAGMQGVLESS